MSPGGDFVPRHGARPALSPLKFTPDPQKGASLRELSDLKGRAVMKPINPRPMIAMLVLVIFLYLWLNGYLT